MQGIKMGSKQDDDVDDFLSSIMHGVTNGNEQGAQGESSKKSFRSKNKHSDNTGISDSNIVRHKLRLWVKLMFMFVGIALFGLAFYLASGPVARLLTPSPFSSEIKESVEFPLYYPTSLPEGFKIETDSIKEAENGVVIYAISNGSGKRVTVSAQKAPENIDINALYSSFDDTYELDTSTGKIKVAKTDDNVHIANLIRDDTWLLLNTPNGNVSTEEFNQILSSIREG